MDKTSTARHSLTGRGIELSIVAAVVLGAFGAGAWLTPWSGPRSERSSAVQVDDVPKAVLRDDAHPPADPRVPEARAVAEKAKIIGRDRDVIRTECRQAADGDWEKWKRDTVGYRVALKAKIDGLDRYPPTANRDYPEIRSQALAARDGFPLLEVGPVEYLNHLYDPALLAEFRRRRSVVAVDRWLRKQGIDLIFVPLPKMAEVYVEHFLDHCPSDGIIAPDVRQSLLELLDDQVEVVDGFPVFRVLRGTDDEYLYNAADTHWAPRGMRIMAKEIAGRIERYKFGARARYGLPIVKVSPGPYTLEPGFGAGTESYTFAQAQRAGAAQPTKQAEVRMQDGRPPPDDPDSPVLVIGNSYVPSFREQLVKELNLLVATRTTYGATTEFFADFLRDPEMLAHTRVVVWITTEQHMTRFKPLPKPIADCLKVAPSPPDTAPASGPSSPP
jgi:hypothetical protein